MNTKLPFDPQLTGHAFASGNDEEQANFFNEMGRFLPMLCKGQMDNQLCYVADKLNNYGENMILALADFVKIKRDKGNA